MKILSLFDGISIARVALERAGIVVDKYYASEIERYALKIAQKNYPDTIQLGDVRNVKKNMPSEPMLKDIAYKLDDIDILIGGSPCTNLSIAKKNREGLAGEQSKLFFEYVRILKELKPKFFILENVASMSKDSKERITQELFGIEPVLICASLVSAQRRRRLFWCGRLNGDTYEQIHIDQPEDRHIYLKDILEDNANDDPKLVINADWTEKLKSNTLRVSGQGSGIDDKHNWDTIRIASMNKGGQADRIYSPEGKSVALSANGGGGGAKTGLYMIQKGHGYNKGGVKSLDGKVPTLTSSSWEQNNHLVSPCAIRGRPDKNGKNTQQLELSFLDKSNALTSVTKDSMVCLTECRTEEAKKLRKEYREKTGKDFSPRRMKELTPRTDGKVNTITTGCTKESLLTDGFIVRKLSPVECERLQGLDDDWTRGVSNSRRYKCCGNGFNADVIAHILTYVKKFI